MSTVVRGAAWHQLRDPDLAVRAACQATRDDAARRVADYLRRDAEVTRLAGEIRELTATLGRCRTPAGRRAVEQRIIPLVQQRRELLGVAAA
jgi:hypothetical protein